MQNRQEHKNVVLLPKTIDYYQVQLTKMLENELYEEAVDLLQFLLACKTEDERTYLEWEALYNWLQDQFIHNEDNEIEETDLLEHHIKEKWSNDKEYTERLIEMLWKPTSFENQLLALEQLAFIPDEQTIQKLIDWLTANERNPLLQFKALQVLKQHEVNKELRLQRLGESVVLKPMDTPLNLNEFPEPVKHVLELVRRQSEINHPNLLYFAEQMWKDFLSFIYGSAQYAILLKYCERNTNACAAALHHVSLHVMSGEGSSSMIANQYGVSTDDLTWEWVVQLLNQFVQRA